MSRILVLEATGETAELLVDATESDGRRVEFITSLPAGADGPPLHIHPQQDERFEVLEGQLTLHAGGTTRALFPGDVHVVVRGTPHRFENLGTGTARWRVTVEPALNFDYLAAAMFDIVNSAFPSPPKPEDLAYVRNEVAGEYYLDGTPWEEQDASNLTLSAFSHPDTPGGPISLAAYRRR